MGKIKPNIYDRIFDFIEKLYYIVLFVIFLLALYNLFFFLKQTPIYSWDEARHGISAYEMIKRNDLIVNTYGYKNDYWNLKPPVSFWAIILGYKIAGFNPLGLRLFSALAALFTIILSTLFVKYKHGKLASLITALVLTTSPKYIVIHSARTGDADALFVFFFTLAIISMLLIERSIGWLYVAGLAFAMAFLTKSWHAFNILIIGAIYLVYSKTIFKLRKHQWVFFIFSAVAPIALWIGLRYSKDGLTFIKAMVNYDLLTRTGTTLEGHIGDHWYYFDTLKDFYYIWLWVLGAGIIGYLVLYSRYMYMDPMKVKRKNYMLGMILWISIPLIIFTKASTKIGWYILPLYPAIAVAIGGLAGETVRGPKRHVLMQILLILIIIKAVLVYQPEINKHIIMFKNDNKRVTFNDVNTLEDINEAKVYIDYGPDAKINVGPISEFKSWQQSDLLSAEFNWDILPQDGGITDFLKDSRDVLIIVPKKPYFQKIKEKENLMVVGESSTVYILGK